ncbi:MAG: TIGR02281 family clan AA aspartic protease [Gammaproteobacteria bacterium]|jgi:aspartyl protease family protein
MTGGREDHEFPKRIGSGMVIAAWIVGLGLMTLLFSGLLSRQQNPNSQVQSRHQGNRVEVVLKQNRAGHYVATAKINRRPVQVLLDTGATDVSVPARLAARLELKRGAQVLVTTANGTVPVYTTRLDEVRLGDITLRNIRATINPHADDDFVLLGMSFLKQLDFSQRGGKLILTQEQ